ncbi:MAG TPA: TorF family putative porin [Steroidobacteraceae bacterium]
MDGRFVMRWHCGYRLGLLLSLAGTQLLALPVSRAETPWSASLGVTSDYIFRGVSQTYDSAAVQLGATYLNPQGWFAGAWASNVNPYPHAGSSAELDLYAGITRPLGADFSTRIAYTRYSYLDDPRPANYNYDEIAVSAAYLDRLAATLSYEPDYSSYSTLGFAHSRPVGALELTAHWPLPNDLAVTAGVGYYDLQSMFGVSYWAGNAGLAYVRGRVTIELNRFFTNGTAGRLYAEQSANGTWTLSALLRL